MDPQIEKQIHTLYLFGGHFVLTSEDGVASLAVFPSSTSPHLPPTVSAQVAAWNSASEALSRFAAAKKWGLSWCSCENGD